MTLVVFPIVTGGAALIFSAATLATSILPAAAIAGGLGLLGIGWTFNFNKTKYFRLRLSYELIITLAWGDLSQTNERTFAFLEFLKDPKTYLKQNVDNEDIEHIFQRVDNTIKHSLEFRNTLYSLQRSQYSQDSQRLNSAQILSC